VVIVRHGDVAWNSGLTCTAMLSDAGKMRAQRLKAVLTTPRAWNISAMYTPTVSCVHGHCRGSPKGSSNKTYALGGTHESETIHPLALALQQRVLNGRSCSDPMGTYEIVRSNQAVRGRTVLLAWNHLAVPKLLSTWLRIGRTDAEALDMLRTLSPEGRRAAFHWMDRPQDFSSMFILNFARGGTVESIEYGHEHLGIGVSRYMYSTSSPASSISRKQIEHEFYNVDEMVHTWLTNPPKGTVYAKCTPHLSEYFFCGSDDCCPRDLCGSSY